MSNCDGQLWIEKNSNKLVKLSGNTNRGDIHFTQVTI